MAGYDLGKDSERQRRISFISIYNAPDGRVYFSISDEKISLKKYFGDRCYMYDEDFLNLEKEINLKLYYSPINGGLWQYIRTGTYSLPYYSPVLTFKQVLGTCQFHLTSNPYRKICNTLLCSHE